MEHSTTFTVHQPVEAPIQRHVGDYFKHPYGKTTYWAQTFPIYPARDYFARGFIVDPHVYVL